MKNFRDLKVWSKGHELALSIYEETRTFPKEEIYGLTSQMRRASVSIPANIAEGCGQGTDKDFARMLHIAMGSASELEYHALLANDLALLDKDKHHELSTKIGEVKKMLSALIAKVKGK